jgi:hypothetical protein
MAGPAILPRGTNNKDFLTEDEKKFHRETFWQTDTQSPADRMAMQPRSLLEDIGAGAVTGTVEGATALPDLIGDALQFGIEQAGGPDMEQFNIPTLTEEVRNIPGYPAPPRTLPGKLVQGAASGITAGALTGGGVAPAQVARMGLAGLGATIGVEATKGRSPGVQLGAGLVGGLAGAGSFGTLAGGARGIGAATGGLIPPLRRALLERQIHRMAAINIPNIEEAFVNAKEAERLARSIPGYTPSLAASSPQLKPFSDVLRRASGDISDRQNKMIRKNVDAIIDKVEDLRSKIPDGSLANAQKAAKHKKAAFQAADEAKLAAAKDRFDDALLPIREEVGDIPSAQTLGGQYREAVETSYKNQKAAFEPRYAPYDTAVQVDPLRSVKAVEALEAKVLKAQVEDLPSGFVLGIIKDLGRPDLKGAPFKGTKGPRGMESLAQMRAVRGRLLQELRNPNATDLNKKFLGELLDEVSGNIDEAIGQTASAELKAINADYAAFKQKFATDTVGKVFKKTKAGVPSRSDVEIFDAFTGVGGGKSVEHFQALANVLGDEQARAMYGRAMMARMMLTKGVRKPDGTFDPAAVERFIHKYEEVLNKLPTVNNQLAELKHAARKAIDAPRRPPTLDDQDLAYVKTLAGSSPERAIKKIVASGNFDEGITELAQLFGDSNAAFRAIARPLWDQLFKEAKMVRGSRTTRSYLEDVKFGEILQQHEKGLRKYYGNDAYESLVDVHNAMRQNQSLTQVTTADPTLPKGDLLHMMRTMASRAFGIARGVIGPAFTGTEVMAKRMAKLIDAFDDKETKLLVDNMMHDPHLITTLSKIKSARDVVAAERNFKKWLRLNAPPAVGAAAQQTFEERRPRSTPPRQAFRHPTETELALGGTHPFRP